MSEICIGQTQCGFKECLADDRVIKIGQKIGCQACLPMFVETLELERDCADIDARTDVLTKLPNRRAFLEKFKEFADDGRPFGMVGVDIENLKYANDTFGHTTGDGVIVATGEFLSGEVREPEDFAAAARIGGDEFALLASLSPRHNKKQLPFVALARIASRIEQNYKQFPIINAYNQDVPAEKSLGLKVAYAVYEPWMTAKDLIDASEPKGYGRSPIVVEGLQNVIDSIKP